MRNASPLFIDIETGPQPADVIETLVPPFDPTAVKVGNLKDPEKILEKIEDARASYMDDAIERAALSPILGQIVGIGVTTPEDGVLVLHTGPDTPDVDGVRVQMCRSEAVMLTWLLGEVLESANLDGRRLAGWNIRDFDIPFIIRRCWANGIRVPQWLLDATMNRYSRDILDLRTTWALGQYQPNGTLDAVCKALGLAGKTGDHGANWHRLINSPEDADRIAAVEYLARDVRACMELHDRFHGNH